MLGGGFRVLGAVHSSPSSDLPQGGGDGRALSRTGICPPSPLEGTGFKWEKSPSGCHPPFSPLRSLQGRPQAPHAKSKFLAIKFLAIPVSSMPLPGRARVGGLGTTFGGRLLKQPLGESSLRYARAGRTGGRGNGG
jgi:hypothetical protein